MTNRLTRSSSRISNNLPNPKSSKDIRELRPRKSKLIIVDSSEDEYFEVVSERQTPKKNNIYSNDDTVTPPKQKKIDVIQTTQQCSDELTNGFTPSSLLHRLSLSSPVKNKITQNRKSLFQEPNDNVLRSKGNDNDKYKTNEEDSTHGKERYCSNELDIDKDLIICGLEENYAKLENATNNSYRNARKALHVGVPNSLPGREKELNVLRNFIKGHIENCSSGSMYVSGPPGTGKTASLSIILQEKVVSMCNFSQFIKIII